MKSAWKWFFNRMLKLSPFYCMGQCPANFSFQCAMSGFEGSEAWIWHWRDADKWFFRQGKSHFNGGHREDTRYARRCRERRHRRHQTFQIWTEEPVVVKTKLSIRWRRNPNVLIRDEKKIEIYTSVFLFPWREKQYEWITNSIKLKMIPRSGRSIPSRTNPAKWDKIEKLPWISFPDLLNTVDSV